jgi:membrane protease YdiL (CAAX protease family)
MTSLPETPDQVPPLLEDGLRMPPLLTPIEARSGGEITGASIFSDGAAASRWRAGPGMWVAVGVTGVLMFFVCLTLGKDRASAPSLSYRVGLALGWLTIWPAVAIALFSIGRRFRSLRVRMIITLVIWSLVMFAHVQDLIRVRSDRLLDFKIAGQERATRLARPTTATAKLGEKPADNLAIDPAAAKEFDFSPGSDERLVKQIAAAQQDRYNRVIEGYRAALVARPDDAALALEWVRFVQHFADAEDITIETAASDLETAKAFLETHFPEAPGTILFELENSFGPDFAAKAARYEGRVGGWPPPDAAKFYLLQAQRADQADATRVEQLARKSFELEPSPDAGILLGKALLSRDRKGEALKVLERADFARASDWLKKQRMDLLFDGGWSEEALKSFEELKRASPAWVNNVEMAKRLARCGLVKEGRTLLGELAPEWNANWFIRQRFEFELEFGNRQQAEAAYEALRSTGFSADPLAREWFKVLRRHPLAAWSGGAAASCAGFLLAILIVAALPFIVIAAPVHYWALWRQQRDLHVSWPISPWGLRAFGGVLAIAGMGVFLVHWYFYPEELRRLAGGVAEAATKARALLEPMVCLWVLMGTTACFLLTRAKCWRLIGAGQWSIGKALGVGVGLALALRGAVFFYVIVFPTDIPVVAQVASPLVEMLKELRAAVGPLGLLLVVAGFVPVLEEVLMRGVFLGAMAKHIPFSAANAIQALGFALLHDSLLLGPFYFGFALIAGEMVRKAKGLLPAIIMHSTNNALACLALIFAGGRLGL